MQQFFQPPPESQSIEIGDSIEVLVGEHMGKPHITVTYLRIIRVNGPA